MANEPRIYEQVVIDEAEPGVYLLGSSSVTRYALVIGLTARSQMIGSQLRARTRGCGGPARATHFSGGGSPGPSGRTPLWGTPGRVPPLLDSRPWLRGDPNEWWWLSRVC